MGTTLGLSRPARIRQSADLGPVHPLRRPAPAAAVRHHDGMGNKADDEQARSLAEVLGATVEPFARGGASRTYRVTGTDELVTAPPGWPARPEPAEEVERRAALLRWVGARVRVPVPAVVRTFPEAGLVVVKRLPGRPLLDLAPERRTALAPAVGAALGGLLAELHTWPPRHDDGLAGVDDTPPAAWHREAVGHAEEIAPHLDEQQRDDVDRFLEQPVPAPATDLAFSHLDLGAEHVLVADDGTGTRVTGVIDWDDAAVGDPALDLALVLRDLGPPGFEAALAAYADGGGRVDGLLDRVRFMAGCKTLEDLAFGHTAGRPSYVGNALRAWPWTMRPP